MDNTESRLVEGQVQDSTPQQVQSSTPQVHKKPKRKRNVIIGVICGVFGLMLVVSMMRSLARNVSQGAGQSLEDLGESKSFDSNLFAFGAAAEPESAPAAEATYDDEYYYEDAGAGAAEDVSSDDTVSAMPSDSKHVTFDENRKLIYRSNVVMETLNYDKTYTDLLALISKYGGYIQTEQYSNDNGSYLLSKDYDREGVVIYSSNDICIRIPRKNYFDFMEDGLSLGNVISRSQDVEDKTAEYSTNESYIDILNKQLDYYQSQMDKLDKEMENAIADNDTERFQTILNDMQYMANEKSKVENSLIPYKQQNEQIDADSSYATINMTLREVKEYTKPVITPEPEDTFYDRLSAVCSSTWSRFLKHCEIFLFIIIRLLPTIVVFGVIFLIVRFCFWKKIKSFKSKGEFDKASEFVTMKPEPNVKQSESIDAPLRFGENIVPDAKDDK